MGFSAGGIVIFTHLVAFSGRDDNLYRQAIIQSGVTPGDFPSVSQAPIVETTFNNLLSSTSCSGTLNGTASEKLECVRGLPVAEFRQASAGVTGMLFDGDMINVVNPYAAIRAGNWTKVPLLVGSNTDEGIDFFLPGANTTAEAHDAMSPLLTNSTQLDALFQLYPDIPALGSPFNTGDAQMSPRSARPFHHPRDTK
ncbi:Ricin B-type lectin domain-containing protein [Mycena indigotica]|uniref:Ricin B-type lectin domain-containing protein n=1 Tax=Mycena indigotica TaxID=2126181 RepID=A0A8H6S225_9AGAR|nr:Ricin B-type lectin domain-containing protein [Mycena indigotica]KAF7291238.1 Ricin B-type lectin domain-containing protein [Mycena indigotica]